MARKRRKNSQSKKKSAAARRSKNAKTARAQKEPVVDSNSAVAVSELEDVAKVEETVKETTAEKTTVTNKAKKKRSSRKARGQRRSKVAEEKANAKQEKVTAEQGPTNCSAEQEKQNESLNDKDSLEVSSLEESQTQEFEQDDLQAEANQKTDSVDELFDNVNALMDKIENVEKTESTETELATETDSHADSGQSELSNWLKSEKEKETDYVEETECTESGDEQAVCETSSTVDAEVVDAEVEEAVEEETDAQATHESENNSQEGQDSEAANEEILAQLNKAIGPLKDKSLRQSKSRRGGEEESITELAAREAKEEVEAERKSASRIFSNEDADALLERFELTSHRMVTLLNQKLTMTLEHWANEFENLKLLTLDSLAENNGESEGGDWEERRKALLQKYTDLEPGSESAIKAGAVGPTLDTSSFIDEEVDSESTDANSAGGLLVETLDSLDENQSEEIAELKKELTAKLREAEIELSINRAKLSQQKAAMEKKEIEVERRESYLRKKTAEFESSQNKKSGFFDRWSRHLSFKKKTALVNDDADNELAE